MSGVEIYANILEALRNQTQIKPLEKTLGHRDITDIRVNTRPVISAFIAAHDFYQCRCIDYFGIASQLLVVIEFAAMVTPHADGA